MSPRTTLLASSLVLLAVGLSACEKAEEPAPAPADIASEPQSVPAITSLDASGAMAEMQSAALEQNGGLSDSNSVAADMATEAGKR